MTLGRREFLDVLAGALAFAAGCSGKPRESAESGAGHVAESTSMPVSTRIMEGKTCLVTGATSGLGSIASSELARMGATVIVAGRNAEKCRRHADAIRIATGSRIETAVADLASLRQVRRMAADVAARFERLDVLVNNAGTYLFERTLTEDGLEKTFAVNYLSHFLLTNLLLERLRASSAARVVNVSSSAHVNGKIELDNLQGERRYDRLDAYARSKLAMLMFTYELARRLRGSTVTANAVHPGVVATELGSEGGMREWLRVRVRNITKAGSMLKPEEGARFLVQAASAPELEHVTGRYLDQGQDVRSSPGSYDEGVAKKLWEISEALVAPSQM